MNPERASRPRGAFALNLLTRLFAKPCERLERTMLFAAKQAMIDMVAGTILAQGMTFVQTIAMNRDRRG